MALSRLREWPRLRFSVAVPLGINGQEALDGTDWGLRTRAWAHSSYFLHCFFITLSLSDSSSARPPRAADASLSPRTAIPRGIALLALGPNYSPKLVPLLGPAQSENHNRFSLPKNRQNPTHSPVLRPVCASLRLRFRSAAFSRALRDSFCFGSPPKQLNRFLRRGTRLSFVPPETALRGRRPGDPGGTERYCVSLNQLSPILYSRACAIHLYSATAEIVESLFWRGARLL